MNVLSLIPYVYEKFSLFILIFARISALFTVFVLFKGEYFNKKVLVSLASIMSIYVLLLNPQPHIYYDYLSLQMVMQLMFQFFLGFLAGLILNIIFDVFNGYGQIISSQIGISLASVIDPSLGNISILTQIYTYAIMLIFLMLNGHLFIIKTIIDSFTIVPVGKMFIPSDLMSNILNYSNVIFTGSILLSMTVIIAMFIVNFASAVMTKFAPQFNIFSVGINLTLILGVLICYSMFNDFANRASDRIKDGLVYLENSIHRLR